MRRLARKLWDLIVEYWFVMVIAAVILVFILLIAYVFSTKPFNVGDTRIELRAYNAPVKMEYKGEKCWMFNGEGHGKCRVKIKNVSDSNITINAWLIKANMRGDVQWTEVLMPGDETDIDHSKSDYPNIMITVK